MVKLVKMPNSNPFVWWAPDTVVKSCEAAMKPIQQGVLVLTISAA